MHKYSVRKYSFPQKLRLKENTQFSRVFDRSKKIREDFFSIFYCENNLDYPRIGIVASKKNIRYAYLRNLFKRIVRDSFRLNQEKLQNYDYIVFAYKVEKIDRKELRNKLEKAWENLQKKL